MASQSESNAAPPPDSVMVFMSHAVETDYKRRDVFPTIRRETCARISGTSSVHWCETAQAQDVLSDARHRRQQVGAALARAYTYHIKALESAIGEAAKRGDWLLSTTPSLSHEDQWRKEYFAIPSQFAALDLPQSLQLPGTESGPTRRATYKDSQGFTCHVTKAFDVWPGAYRIRVLTPKEVLAAARAKKRAEQAPDTSSSVHMTPEAFRAAQAQKLIDIFTYALPCVISSSDLEFDNGACNEIWSRIHGIADYMRHARVVSNRPEDRLRIACSNAVNRLGPRKGRLTLIHSATRSPS